MNLYRSIGGRVNASGVERVNRDGQVEILQMGDAEVTPKERMAWYAKGKVDPRGEDLKKDCLFEVAKDDSHGNTMNVDADHRTSLPRKSQYSTEARLNELRGDKASFHKSEGCEDRSVGIIDGMVLSPDDTRSYDKTKKPAKTKKPLKTNKKEKKASTCKTASQKQKDKIVINAFSRVSSELRNSDILSDDFIVSLSYTLNISVEDVIALEKVSKGNSKLAHKYAKYAILTDEEELRKIKEEKKNKKPCKDGCDIPGNEESDGLGIEKSSDVELKAEELQNISFEVGLT